MAAGTVHTPQILQLSSVSQANMLTKLRTRIVVDLPSVGQNFQDQPTLYAIYKCESVLSISPSPKGSHVAKPSYIPLKLNPQPNARSLYTNKTYQKEQVDLY